MDISDPTNHTQAGQCAGYTVIRHVVGPDGVLRSYMGTPPPGTPVRFLEKHTDGNKARLVLMSGIFEGTAEDPWYARIRITAGAPSWAGRIGTRIVVRVDDVFVVEQPIWAHEQTEPVWVSKRKQPWPRNRGSILRRKRERQRKSRTQTSTEAVDG